MITAEQWSWRYTGRTQPATRQISFTIRAGERVLILGPSGAGKSTILAGIAGVLGNQDEGQESGRLLIDGKHPTTVRGRVGLVMQDPQSQIIMPTVGDEVAFGCENMGFERREIWRRVRESLDQVQLRVPLDWPTGALSGGQKQRMAIAAGLAMRSQDHDFILCLDEPTANLDLDGMTDVHDAIAACSPRDTVVIVEHRVAMWLDVIDRIIVVTPSGVIADGAPHDVLTAQRDVLVAAGVWVPGVKIDVEPRQTSGETEPVLWSEGLTTGYEQTAISHDLDVAIPAGCSTMITGANGAGKSTLALTLAGLLPPLAGQVKTADALRPRRKLRSGLWGLMGRRREDLDVVDHRLSGERAGTSPLFDPRRWTSRELLTRIGTVFQHPEHQFVESTVRKELAVGLVALGVTHEAITKRVDELLERLHLAGLADANPFTLSGGEQRRLSVATVLATHPQVIFLDEPTFGQDRNTWLDLVELIRSMLDEGRTVISVTHDTHFQRLLGENEIRVER